MRYAICADTPYQMLNAVNLACNTIGASDSKDLFFGNVSEEMSRIFLKIKKYHRSTKSPIFKGKTVKV